jgi:hypothetical protein
MSINFSSIRMQSSFSAIEKSTMNCCYALRGCEGGLNSHDWKDTLVRRNRHIRPEGSEIPFVRHPSFLRTSTYQNASLVSLVTRL